MITTAEFVRFRGFERMRAELAPHAYIVGPNSAGKSTVIEAIALAEQCLRHARRKSATLRVRRNGETWRGFLLPESLASADDPVRYDFGRQETRVSVQWGTGGRVHMVWPEEGEDDQPPFFYLENGDRGQPMSPAATRELFPPVTIVPVITPLDQTEDLKDRDYVEKNSSSRLASRHFRNHAWRMVKTLQWDEYTEFCKIWVPEIELLDVSLDAGANRLAVFYSEPGSRVPKELAWAGDGIQIWVQLLWHLLRAKGAKTIVLDEPEVYLHSDLQRRLVRLLDGMSAQIVLASHSADVIAEAPPDGVLWVDRRLGGARRVKSQQSLSALSTSLGSTYNLALARSMRSRLVIACDCEDTRVIRLLSKHVGAANLTNEHIVSIVQLRKFDDWADSKHFGQSLREMLPPKVPAIVLLEAGLRPETTNDNLASSLTASGLKTKMWSRSEMENYLIDTETICRASGAGREAVAVQTAEIISGLREATRAKYISERVALANADSAQDVLSAAGLRFDQLWQDPASRLKLASGKHIIRELNVWIESQGYRPITAHALAKNIRPQSILPEVLNILLEIDELVPGPDSFGAETPAPAAGNYGSQLNSFSP